jgi:hypothetical protein
MNTHLLSASENSTKDSAFNLKQELLEEKMKMIYKDKSPLDKASLWSKGLFSWAYPLINYARTN